MKQSIYAKIIATSLLTSLLLTGCASTDSSSTTEEGRFSQVAADPANAIPLAPPVTKQKTEETKRMLARESYNSNMPMYTGGPAYKRVRTIVDRLSATAGLVGDPYPVYIAQTNDINAFAINSNTIVVFEGILKLIESDDELAVVLGHELSHILHQDAEDHTQQERASSVGAMASVLGTVASVAVSAAGYGGLADLAGNVAATTTQTVGFGAYVQGYSRDVEARSDYTGLLLMAKSGYNPQVAPGFWVKMSAGGESTSDFFSSHPAEAKRIDNLNALMPVAMEFYKKLKKIKK